MRLLHLADLHIGKRLNEFNLIEDQTYILSQIIQIALEQQVQGVLIAGDVYDKIQPNVEAVELLDEFLTQLTNLNLEVLMISGNHDSPERLSFGSRILQKNGLHVAGGFNGQLQTVKLTDQHGSLNVYLLPFIRPVQVRPFFEKKIDSYDQAIEAILSTAQVDQRERNILIAHQFVISAGVEPERSDSEIVSVGGLDAVDAGLFAGFDYVALGHLHRPQRIGSDTIRYGGSPLKYSFSEARQAKSVTVIDFGPKGQLQIEEYPLLPKRDLREIKGPLAELLTLGQDNPAGCQDYLRITLTDEGELYDPLGQLRLVYPNLMALDFENSRTARTSSAQAAIAADFVEKTALELFSTFYELQNGKELTEEELGIMQRIFDQAGGAL